MTLAINPAVVLVPDRDGYLAVHTGSGQLFHLNATAALVAELIRARASLEALERALEPAIGKDSWQDCRAWIDGALTDGLLVGDAGGDVEPENPERLVSLAEDWRAHDRVLAAYICQSRAAELAPDDPGISYGLGELAHIVGRRDVARAAYARYFEAFPDDAEIEHLLVSLNDQAAPGRVPDRCIKQLYARFSEFYDDSMRSDLAYRAPELLLHAIGHATGGRCGLTVLDLGCGSGLGAEPLRPKAARLVGVDLSPEMIATANRRGIYDDLVEAEITEYLAAAAERFDLILSCDALIYFGDLGGLVALAAARLRPGGVLAFTLERSEDEPVRLTDSGRFAHHRSHVVDVAAAAGLSVDSIDDAVLRREYGEPVVGLVVVCRQRHTDL